MQKAKDAWIAASQKAAPRKDVEKPVSFTVVSVARDYCFFTARFSISNYEIHS
jgi:hypothetical protein